MWKAKNRSKFKFWSLSEPSTGRTVKGSIIRLPLFYRDYLRWTASWTVRQAYLHCKRLFVALRPLFRKRERNGFAADASFGDLVRKANRPYSCRFDIGFKNLAFTSNIRFCVFYRFCRALGGQIDEWPANRMLWRWAGTFTLPNSLSHQSNFQFLNFFFDIGSNRIFLWIRQRRALRFFSLHSSEYLIIPKRLPES